jgi:hypothetical protein
MIKHILGVVFLASAGIALAESHTGATQAQRSPSLEQMTMTLLGERAAGIEERIAAAAERARLLARLVESDPAQVLRMAVSPDFRATLPTTIRDLVEENVELEGTLEVLVEDRHDGSRQLNFLRLDSGERYRLYFASQAPRLLTSERVKVTGLRVGQAIAVASGATDVVRVNGLKTESTPAALSGFGAQSTAVLLVNFASSPTQPYTAAAARSVVFGTTSNFDLENSYQQTWLTGDVFGWYTIPLSPTVCDPGTLASQAQAAATAAGVNLSGYAHYVYAFPDNACGWWGLGTVGGSPSSAWINGSLQLMVVAHEMGHNFGLWHSHALDCGTVVLAPSCTSIEYGDVLDTMGGNPYHFNAFQKERLGWLNAGSSPPIRTVTASGTYSIDPYETVGSAPKALKIARGTTGSFFYVEVRRGLGFDSSLSGNANVSNGVVVHLASPSDGNSSELLDMTASTASWYDPALTVGQTFTDTVSNVSITTNSVGATGASVTVSLSGAPPPPTCSHVNPTVNVSPSPAPGVPAHTMVSFTISVSNRDVSPCTASTFNLQATAVSGWTMLFGSTTLSIPPGATSSTTLQVTSPTTAAGGTYPINATARNAAAASAMASFQATYVVSTAGGGGGSGTFTDNFNRADSSSLGAPWLAVSGALVVKGNAMKNAFGQGIDMAVVSTLTGPTQTVSADFTSPDNNLGPRFGLVLRYQDARNYYLIYRQVGGTSRLIISKFVNGVETVLGYSRISNPPKNVAFRMTARVATRMLFLDFNGVNMASATDGTFSTGKVGILIGSGGKTTQYQADNFTASVQP